MGRLANLELHNFKSYRGTTKVSFGSSHFTSIVGPNGAGKSNMMDAISFVLGVRSGHLRSSHLQDLIYRKRLGDSDDVSLSSNTSDTNDLDNDADANSSSVAYVTATYVKNSGEELLLKRSITRAGTSVYSINGKTVSAGEYADILKEEQILIRARNFLVFQGDVEQIASQSPMELTKLIETICGSAEYKTEYEELREQQEKIHEATNSLFQRKRVLNGELKQYKTQKSESESFKKKMQEKAKVVLMFKLWRLHALESNKNDLIDDLEAQNDELKKLETKLHKGEEKLKKWNAIHAKDTLSINKDKDSVATLQKQLSSLDEELVPLTTQRDSIMKKIAESERKCKDLSRDIENESRIIDDLHKQKLTVSKSLKVFEQQHWGKDSVGVEFDDETLKQYESLRQEFFSKGGATLEDTVNELYSDKTNIQLKIDSLGNQKNSISDRLDVLKRSLAQHNAEYSANAAKKDDVMEDIGIKTRYVQELRDKREKSVVEEFEINTKIRDILLKLDDFNSSQRESLKDKKNRENVQTLQKLFPGVLGLVHELCRPKSKKFDTAVSSVLGGNFNSIIVESLTVAQKCISYMKEQRCGSASFIPLDTIDARPLNLNLRQVHPQGARPSTDVIDYDPVLERAMQYICGDSIICDDLSIAKTIRWEKNIEVKLVTLDGSVVHKSGLMTGGKTKNDHSWDKVEFSSSTKEKDSLVQKLQEIQQSRPSEVSEKQAEAEISELQTELEMLKNNGKEITRAIDDATREIEFQEETIEELDTKIETEEQKLLKIQADIDVKEEEIAELQKTVYADFEENFHVSVLEYEKYHGKALREKEQERAKFIKQVSVLENKISFEQSRLTQNRDRLTNVNESIENLKQQLQRVKEERNGIQEKISVLETEIEVYSAKVSEAEADLRTKRDEINDFTEKVKESQRKFESCFKKCSNLEEDIERELMVKVDILKQCVLENIDIPLLEGSLQSIPMSEDPEHLIEISEDIVVDYRKLPNFYKTEMNVETTTKDFEDRIKRITQELEALSPNHKALDRMEDVEFRLKEIDKEYKATKEQEDEILAKFAAVKQKRHDSFMKAFEYISENIDSVYKELTKSKTSPLGGSAYLTLEDEEEPYNSGIKYHPMPPLKRFRDLELLSGGEKTVAALALLFAIHSYQPSPFFVLDEVDAALDHANVQRVANYIRERASPNFQFIVISLKNGLFERSDSLVGIYREQMENSSKTLTYDLRNVAMG